MDAATLPSPVSTRAAHESPRRHADLFTPGEAVAYLRLDLLYPENDAERLERTLETLRSTHDLTGQRIGKSFMYHRRHLDTLVLRLFGIPAPSGKPA